MRYFSTKDRTFQSALKEAVIEGIAPDGGLFFPQEIPALEPSFFSAIRGMSLSDIAVEVSSRFFAGDIAKAEVESLVRGAINFDAPLVSLSDKLYSLELFHGPTLAFKDFGARFMAALLTHFCRERAAKVTVLVATSGDTGSAVASSFLGRENIEVIILYPSGKVSLIQEKQLTTLGGNITALEVKGTFDDCQRFVKQAFLDDDLKKSYTFTSANSINIARLIPQSFYYFYAYSRLPADRPAVFSVPSGNFGNLTGGLIAQKMGLPIKHFIAGTNINDTFPRYLESGIYQPKPSKETISNAMDVGDPSNFARINQIFAGGLDELNAAVSSYSVTDDETKKAMQELSKEFGYISDPHGAVAYLALKRFMRDEPEITGVFLETAHPAKFLDVVEEAVNQKVAVPERLRECLDKDKLSISIENDYNNFKEFLLRRV